MAKLLALPASDPELSGPTVSRTFSMVPQLAKKIEPVGHGYAKLQYNFLNGIRAQPLEEEKKREVDDDEMT